MHVACQTVSHSQPLTALEMANSPVRTTPLSSLWICPVVLVVYPRAEYVRALAVFRLYCHGRSAALSWHRHWLLLRAAGPVAGPGPDLPPPAGPLIVSRPAHPPIGGMIGRHRIVVVLVAALSKELDKHRERSIYSGLTHQACAEDLVRLKLVQRRLKQHTVLAKFFV